MNWDCHQQSLSRYRILSLQLQRNRKQRKNTVQKSVKSPLTQRSSAIFSCECLFSKILDWFNREYLALQTCNINNRFHLEANLPWSYDYPLANHIPMYKSSAKREVPLSSRHYPSFGYLRKIFLPRGLKYSLCPQNKMPQYISEDVSVCSTSIAHTVHLVVLIFY